MIEILAQAEQVSQISGSIQGGLGCLGAAIGVGIVGMKGCLLYTSDAADE